MELRELTLLKDQLSSEIDLKRPKKCLSSYMIFVREMRPKVIEEMSDIPVLDVMK